MFKVKITVINFLRCSIKCSIFSGLSFSPSVKCPPLDVRQEVDCLLSGTVSGNVATCRCKKGQVFAHEGGQTRALICSDEGSWTLNGQLSVQGNQIRLMISMYILCVI